MKSLPKKSMIPGRNLISFKISGLNLKDIDCDHHPENHLRLKKPDALVGCV
jgi:hypothetical protein